MVVAGSKIGTIDGMIKHLPAPPEPLQQLLSERCRGATRHIPRLQFSLLSVPAPEKIHGRHHFPSDNDMHMAATRCLHPQAAYLFDTCIQKSVSLYNGVYTRTVKPKVRDDAYAES
ncbi:hypothetical protein AVEN_215713-1 [Araneus ventricosus]|uniref:Uncharacterized protein n=1 Tax=Araneus ventricosus TaxID=182803 RepID=A0A4Y2NA28_ARAVE|nr:hypothetical protein AVEN_215713-1 [Araneus ventricosus]